MAKVIVITCAVFVVFWLTRKNKELTRQVRDRRRRILNRMSDREAN